MRLLRSSWLYAGLLLAFTACSESELNPNEDVSSDTTPTPDADTTPTPDADTTPTPDADTTPTPDADTTPTPDADTTPDTDTAPDTDTDTDTDEPLKGNELCGNGVLDNSEVCDGTEIMDDATCQALGFSGGTATCSSACTLDTSACTTTDVCGDGVRGPSEYCDGAVTETCQGLGFSNTGSVSCNNTCSGLDISMCVNDTIPGWTCPPAWYGDSDGYCDCGCGIIDIDCANGGIDSCEYCSGSGSCNEGDVGCGRINAEQNGLCVGQEADTCGNNSVGAGELCDGSDLRSLSCVDFPGYSGGTLACSNTCTAFDFSACDAIDIPAEWTCREDWFADGQYCDCACGAMDPDCGDNPTIDSCTGCPDTCDFLTCSMGAEGFVDPNDLTQCIADEGGGDETPAGWTCDASWYGDGECDCGCGVQDRDCADNNINTCSSCGPTCGTNCILVDENDPTQCPTPDGGDTDPEIPAGWTCEAQFYGDDACDCGCGVQDIDCADASINSCEFCGAECESFYCIYTGVEGFVDPNNTTQCAERPEIPDGWTCHGSWYADNTCDCGCGVQDSDCATSDVSACEACINCNDDDCSQNSINPNDSTQCVNP